jgi:4-hydroxy-2-oxoheptanedioate aldolase
MEMRKSRVLRQMRNGKVATCVKINLSDLRNVDIAAMCGFDCVWTDMEHVPNDFSFIENAVRAAKVYDCDTLTRVARGCYSNLIRPLEADSTGIMVPHLMSLEDAKQVVYYTKFAPVGRRPIDGGNADGAYCLVDEQEYIKCANEERFVVVQIEDPEPMSELEEICSLPGLDMIFFGPADFSQGVGHTYDMNCHEVVEARKRIADCARRHGKFAGTTGSPANFDELVDIGYTFISTGADVCGLSDYYSAIVAEVSGKNIK